LLGLVIEGGQGLATADDRRFIAAVEGTPEADDARRRRGELEDLTLGHEAAGQVYREIRGDDADVETALLAVADRFHPQDELHWPRGGLIRIAPQHAVRTTRLREDEVEQGIAEGSSWVPFEKGDNSGQAGAASWWRSNPLVIDWSPAAVALLRHRASGDVSYRKPRLQNERLWGQAGITWNRVASYLRVRAIPDGSIFADMAPVIRPQVAWLSTSALLALLNAPTLDFILRTFLGSRMHVEIGDLRRLPIPVLTALQGDQLDDFGRRAVMAKKGDGVGRGEPLAEIEREVDLYVRGLYGLSAKTDFWVVR